jgi:hypothetical protein
MPGGCPRPRSEAAAVRLQGILLLAEVAALGPLLQYVSAQVFILR